MVDFVEQATLSVRDRSTKTLRLINREIKKLRSEARRLDGLRVDLRGTNKAINDVDRLNAAIRKIPRSKTSSIAAKVTGLAAARKQLDSVSRTRKATVEARATRVGLVKRQLDRLATSRVATVQASLGAAAFSPTPQPRGPRVTQRPSATSFGDGVRSAFNPAQIGRDMARTFSLGVSQELLQAARATIRSAGTGVADFDDAIARVKIAGRTDEELDFIKAQAKQLSSQFQAVTEAQIISASGDVTGRFGDLSDPEQQALATQALTRIAQNTQIIDQALGNRATGGAENQARLVETAIQQLGATGDAERSEAISQAVLKAIIASGGDLTASDVKRTLQQLPAGRSAITPETLTQVLLVRDEGGRRSTGNFDQLLSDLTRGNLNDADKATQLAAAEKYGLEVRGEDGNSKLFNDLANDFLGTVARDIVPLLRANGIEISRDNVGEIRAFFDNELGLSKQGGITFITDAAVNLEESLAEYNRALQTRPEVALEELTLRQELASINAQFKNVAATALEPLLPTVKGGLDVISDTLSGLAAGEEVGAAQLATATAAAVPLALAAGLQATMDPATRPLGLAGIALSGSATSLSAAAAALTGAAAVNGAANLGRGRAAGRTGRAAGLLGGLARLLGSGAAVGVAAAVTPTQLNGDETTESVKRANEQFEALGSNVAQFISDSETRAANLRTQGFDDRADEVLATARDVMQRSQAGEDIGQLPSYEDALARDRQFTANIERLLQNATAENAVMAQPVIAPGSELQPEAYQPGGERFGSIAPASAEQVDHITSLLERNDANRAPIVEPSFDNAVALMGLVPNELEMAFGEGRQMLLEVPNELMNVAATMGPMIGQALLAIAPQMGQAIGAAAGDAIGVLQTTSAPPSQEASLNTGGTVLE